MSAALLVVDVQQGFHEPGWGRRDNPAFEANLAALLADWRARGAPVVLVRHDSVDAGSPLHPSRPGNALQPWVEGPHDLLVAKAVNSAFLGDVDLAAWLRGRGIAEVVVTGIQTNMCCETTARVGANLGFALSFVLDATHTFDLPAHGGGTIAADELARVTASNIDPEFGRVVTTAEAVASVSG